MFQPSTTTVTPQSDTEYCRLLVRANDRERYLVALFAPGKRQQYLWALFAFNQEIAKIRENVSEPALGEIRLQWWQEVLAEISAGQVRDQPVIRSLARIENKADIWPFLGEMINARKLDMFSGSPANMKALQTYTAGAGGALHEAVYHLLTDSAFDAGYGETSRAAGCAWAMLGLIRALPAHWQTGRSYVPEAQAGGMSATNSGEAFQLLAPAILEMRAYVEEKCAHVLAAGAKFPKSARICLLFVKLIHLHLRSLDKCGNNPFEMPAFEVGDLQKMTGLFWSNMRGRY